MWYVILFVYLDKAQSLYVKLSVLSCGKYKGYAAFDLKAKVFVVYFKSSFQRMTVIVCKQIRAPWYNVKHVSANFKINNIVNKAEKYKGY